MEATRSVVDRQEDGGWVTSSQLSRPLLPDNGTEILVECRAKNPAVDEVVKRVTTITITSEFL